MAKSVKCAREINEEHFIIHGRNFGIYSVQYLKEGYHRKLVCREIVVYRIWAYLSSRTLRVEFNDSVDMGNDTRNDTHLDEKKLIK